MVKIELEFECTAETEKCPFTAKSLNPNICIDPFGYEKVIICPYLTAKRKT
jgi:hypothetical protein